MSDEINEIDGEDIVAAASELTPLAVGDFGEDLNLSASSGETSESSDADAGEDLNNYESYQKGLSEVAREDAAQWKLDREKEEYLSVSANREQYEQIQESNRESDAKLEEMAEKGDIVLPPKE